MATRRGTAKSQRTTPTYIVKSHANTGITNVAWDIKINGKPTQENLERWRRVMNASFGHGGVNEHISRSAGIIVHVSRAILFNQKTKTVVAEVVMPMFEVI